MRTTRLHVVGCHRSGTTLMTELIGNGFEIDGRAQHEQSLWEPVPLHHGIFLTKKPPDTIRIRRAFLLDPDLYVIAMVRDPRDVIVSHHPQSPDVYFSSFWRWAQYLEAILALEKHPRCLVVRYEDLVVDPDAVQAEIAHRFPFLRRTTPFSRFPEGAEVHDSAQLSMNGARAVNRASIGHWRCDLPRIKGELARHPEMAAWLIRIGYERDERWTECLETVEPYFGSYKNQRPHLLRRSEAAVRFGLKTLRYLWRRRVWIRS